MPGFTHLHVHSEYSLLDGLIRVDDLPRAAKQMGFDAIALTDHGAMHGVVQFYRKARQEGVKPIIGCELYVAPRARTDRDPERDRSAYHLTVLAQDQTGYQNLLRLTSLAQLEGFYYKPRVDRELLARYSDGLIVLSGCVSAELPLLVSEGRMDRARETLTWYKDVFDGRYFVEIQSHDKDFSPDLNKHLVGLARQLDLPLAATNDVHYLRPEDFHAHEVLLCLQTGTTMTNPDRMRYGTTFYMRSADEMADLFSEVPQAVANTAAIAERCNVQLSFGDYKLPAFEVPAGHSATSYLRQLCESGIVERYSTLSEEMRSRLEHELSIIQHMGFENYFLIVWDLCRYARNEGIWWNVRGSAAGSIVAYALHITSIDPLAHDLIFERFLNPARVSMPDIDLDFPDDQRDQLIRYVFDRYGHDRVAQIITFGTMGARAAIRDAGRALDMPLSDVDRVARLVPAIPGKPCSISDTLRPDEEGGDTGEFYQPELAALYESDEDVHRLIETALSLEGVARHASTHAAGVVIADRALTEYVPLHRATHGSAGGKSLPVTQFAMNDIERLGLLKVDFLGLSTLTVLRRASELVHEYHGRRYLLEDIPLDDPAIYDLLASGNVTGVFQVEGAGIRRMLRSMQPKKFEHIVAAIALYRPGPMVDIPKYIRRLHGDEPVTYRHPALETVLQETFGIIVYQEQIIQIARALAGYDPGEADTIRKAVAKKIKHKLLQHRSSFVTGATERGIPRDAAERIFADIEDFARYGFNKAHSADYAMIVCQTAWFKAHYTVEYMTALLSVARGDSDKIALVAADCHSLGIKLLPPDVNASRMDFAIEPLDEDQLADGDVRRRRGIRFGLAAIKNVGEGPVRVIVRAREEGEFSDLDDFCRRVDLRAVGKRALESLIKAGALECFAPRSAALPLVDRMVGFSAAHQKAAAVGQMSLFGGAMPATSESLICPPTDVSGDRKEELKWEKDLLGTYVSEHPLHQAAESLSDIVTARIGDVDAEMAGQRITLAGMVASIRPITTRKGDAMAFVQLEDLQGRIEVTLFPKAYEATHDVWREDEIVVVRGKVDVRAERLQIIADTAEAFAPEAIAERARTDRAPARPADDSPACRLTVTIPRSLNQDSDIHTLGRAYEILTGYEGRDHFLLVVHHDTGPVELEFPNASTHYCVSLLDRLESLLGQGSVEVSASREP